MQYILFLVVVVVAVVIWVLSNKRYDPFGRSVIPHYIPILNLHCLWFMAENMNNLLLVDESIYELYGQNYVDTYHPICRQLARMCLPFAGTWLCLNTNVSPVRNKEFVYKTHDYFSSEPLSLFQTV